ncbi:MAG: hypothetical protein K0S65_6563 [Labilithrix sp.]|nr:hypothetical protein [Labilithrix sp.]
MNLRLDVVVVGKPVVLEQTDQVAVPAAVDVGGRGFADRIARIGDEPKLVDGVAERIVDAAVPIDVGLPLRFAGQPRGIGAFGRAPTVEVITDERRSPRPGGERADGEEVRALLAA